MHVKWWMREDWQERLTIALGVFLLLFGIGDVAFGHGGFQRWVLLVLGALVLITSVLRFRQRLARDRAPEDDADGD